MALTFVDSWLLSLVTLSCSSLSCPLSLETSSLEPCLLLLAFFLCLLPPAVPVCDATLSCDSAQESNFPMDVREQKNILFSALCRHIEGKKAFAFVLHVCREK